LAVGLSSGRFSVEASPLAGLFASDLMRRADLRVSGRP
jgi:hypothetical protein